jgi:AAA15 family ATPase/GTPase
MLNSLHIKNFRSLENFEISKLGRLNLIVGKNNSGKSTVLEALRIYAGNANGALLEKVAAEHNEKYRLSESDKNNEDTDFPFEHFFAGRVFPDNDDGAIQIADSSASSEALKINHVYFCEVEETITDDKGDEITKLIRKTITKPVSGDAVEGDLKQALAVTLNDKTRLIDIERLTATRRPYRASMMDLNDYLPCSFIPTQFTTIDELADIWDKVVYTEQDVYVKRAMEIIVDDFENLVFVKNEEPARFAPDRDLKRFAKVKLKSLPRPVPLNSMGDGMYRVLQLILKLFPAKGGFFLIDEFENGLHYSIQEKVWTLLFELAEKLDIQVFATTHSWDCIESFCKVATENTRSEGVLFRMGRSIRTSDHGRIIATVFDREKLADITQADVEVR